MLLLAAWVGAGTAPALATGETGRPPAGRPEGGPIAVKLAPGVRLAETAAGSLTVVHDWAALETARGVTGLPLREAGRLPGLGVTLLEPTAGEPAAGPGAQSDAAWLVLKLRLLPGVLWAETGTPLAACLEPNDPHYVASGSSPGQWGTARVGLPAAWDLSTGSGDVVVAVLDTGINPNIPDFSGRIVSPYDVATASSAWPAWQDVSEKGHGTAVAGVAVAQGNNGQGIAGAAWNVKIMPVKISENGDSDTVTLATAIEYAVDSGADVVNISFATPPGATAGQTLKDAVSYAIGKGVVVVAAAGNSDAAAVSYPAALPGVIAVGATDTSDARWASDDDASNRGSALDLAAPGARIVTFYKANAEKFGYYGGTSMASPLVAGTAALMLSVDTSLTPAEIAEILTDTADDLGERAWDDEFGWGLVDAEEAVARAAAEAGGVTIPGRRFADVSEGITPYWREIEYLGSLGIVVGTTDGLFRPGESIKRQQFAKMIVMAAGCSVSEAGTCPFVDVLDVPGDLYPYHYVAAAYQCGITNGTSPGRFSPYRTLTRAQLITMVTRTADLPEPPEDYTPPFGNFSMTHYPYARRAAYAGLLDGLVGMGAGFDFSVEASRGEVCAVLYALLGQ